MVRLLLLAATIIGIASILSRFQAFRANRQATCPRCRSAMIHDLERTLDRRIGAAVVTSAITHATGRRLVGRMNGPFGWVCPGCGVRQAFADPTKGGCGCILAAVLGLLAISIGLLRLSAFGTVW